MYNLHTIIPLTDPWDKRYIYLPLVDFYGFHVGTYTVRPHGPYGIDTSTDHIRMGNSGFPTLDGGRGS